MLDTIVTTDPDDIFAIFPTSPISNDAGVRTITYKELANVVNGLAWWLDSNLGKDSGEAFAYIGPNDVRVPALGLAGVKSGTSV
jgi:acyl-coenzyme A synthetase/AMP-(fatty) acid ligase